MAEVPILVTIDGGAAAGKSSTSRLLAERFDLLHVDTGSHYRALTLHLLRAGVDAKDAEAVGRGVASLVLGTAIDDRLARITLDGWQPEAAELRSDAVNAAVSTVAAIPCVREKLKTYQRGQTEVAAAAGFRGLIMEGRDIGSVIFPEARCRFFLEADAAARAERRAAEGQVDAVAERDRQDASRKTAPMVCPEGAVRIDSTHLPLRAVVEKIAFYIEEAF